MTGYLLLPQPLLIFWLFSLTSETSVFDIHCTTCKHPYHRDSHCHAIVLFVDLLQKSQVHQGKNMASPHHIATHFLCFKTVRSIIQLSWISLNNPFTHPGRLPSLRLWAHVQRSSHTLAVLYRPGTSPSLYGSFSTASLHISSVLK